MEKDYIYNVLLERGYNTYTARLVTEELLKLHKPLSEYLTSVSYTHLTLPTSDLV